MGCTHSFGWYFLQFLFINYFSSKKLGVSDTFLAFFLTLSPMIFIECFLMENLIFEIQFRFDHAVWQKIKNSHWWCTRKKKNQLYLRYELLQKAIVYKTGNLVMNKALPCVINSRLISYSCKLFWDLFFYELCKFQPPL